MLVAIAAAAAGVAWLGLHLHGRGRTAGAPRLLDVTPEAVTALSISGADGSVRLARAGAEWRVVAPRPGPADGRAVRAVLDALASLERRATIAPAGEPPARLRPYGLAEPRALVEATVAGGRLERLALGADNGEEGTMFVMPTTGEVAVIRSVSGSAFERALRDLVHAGSGAGAPAAERDPAARGGG